MTYLLHHHQISTVLLRCNSSIIYNLEAAPPAATIHSPVIKLASSDTRKATTDPISSGFPNLLIGIVLKVASFAASDEYS